MTLVNKYGRPRDELDDIRARVCIEGSFALYSADGIAMCGRHVPGQQSKRFVDHDWTVEKK